MLLHQASYHLFGPVTGWSYGNGRQMLRSLDQDYRPLAVQDPGTGGLSLNFGFDAVGNLTQLTSDSPPPLSFVYDPLGRLTETRDGPTQAAIDTYHYDKTGNRTAHITAAGTPGYLLHVCTSFPTRSRRSARRPSSRSVRAIKSKPEMANRLDSIAPLFYLSRPA